MNIDYEHSMVQIADRWFPSVVVLCPPVALVDEPPFDRVDFSLVGGVMATVPLENGVLVEIVEDTRDGVPCLDVYLLGRRCDYHVNAGDKPQWLPQFLGLDGTRLFVAPRALAFVHHEDPDPEWLCEWIDRVSRLHLPDDGDGPYVTLLPMRELPKLRAELHERIEARRG